MFPDSDFFPLVFDASLGTMSKRFFLSAEPVESVASFPLATEPVNLIFLY